MTLECYDNGKLINHGSIKLKLQHYSEKSFQDHSFYVVETKTPKPIIVGHPASIRLGLIRVLCKNISKSVLAIEKTPANSTKNSFQDHQLRIDSKTPWRCQRSKSESSVHSFQDHHSPDHHGDKKSGKSVLSRPSTKCAKTEPKSGSSKAIEPQNVHKKGSFKTIEDGSKKDTSFKTIVNRVKNLNPQYMVPVDEATQVVSDPKTRKKAQPVTEQPSSGPPPPGSRFNPIYVEPGSVSIDSTRDLQALFPNSFDCIRDMQGEYDIKTDLTVPPVQHRRRKDPIEYKEEIEKELAEMVQQRIITKQTEPTPWVSSLMYPKKANGKLRICLDPKDLNKAIIRENHKAPTLKEIAHVLMGATKFSKVDGNKAFFGMHLMEEASLLTTFNTHLGRYSFLHVPFGPKMSQDIFQMRMDDIVAQCPGVLAIHNNVFIYRKNDRDHDANINLFNVAQKEGLIFNSKKCAIKQESVMFFGGVFSAEGYSPDLEKIQGISEMTPPQTKQELQSFLGAVNYLQTFVPHLSLNTEPLQALLKKENCFAWDENTNTCFQKIKSQLQKALLRPLRYYDRTKPVTLQCDASLKGLGACIIQDGQPIAFASKSFMDTETRYANIKRELLAIIYGCEKFYTYLYGRTFIMETDHKPLKMISLKNLTVAPACLQRMLLHLQQYDLVIMYWPGREMLLADALSCLPSRTNSEIKLDLQVNAISMFAFTPRHLTKIGAETQQDPILLTVHRLTLNGWPDRQGRVPRAARF